MFNPSQFYMPARTLAPLARKTINWAGLLTNTQKTLNIVNQAIPIVYQVKPLVNNAKTMFRVASELTKSNTNTSNKSVSNIANKHQDSNSYSNLSSSDNNEGPSFFI